VFAQSIELSGGVILAAILAVVGPLAILGGGFIAWGRLRQQVDDMRAQLSDLRDADAKLADEQRKADAALAERLRVELDAHASVLGDRIDLVRTTQNERRTAGMREVWSAVRSLQRWRERLRGAEEARAAAQHAPLPSQAHQGVPHHVSPDTTTPAGIPVPPNPPPLPRVHQSSARYPAALEDSGDRDDYEDS